MLDLNSSEKYVDTKANDLLTWCIFKVVIIDLRLIFEIIIKNMLVNCYIANWLYWRTKHACWTIKSCQVFYPPICSNLILPCPPPTPRKHGKLTCNSYYHNSIHITYLMWLFGRKWISTASCTNTQMCYCLMSLIVKWCYKATMRVQHQSKRFAIRIDCFLAPIHTMTIKPILWFAYFLAIKALPFILW